VKSTTTNGHIYSIHQRYPKLSPFVVPSQPLIILFNFSTTTYRKVKFVNGLLPAPCLCRVHHSNEPCYTCTLHPPSSFLYNKKIGFKEKVVSDVTSETTFSLKSIFLRERERQRGNKGCIYSISPLQ
jgi:hypothetical protein